MNGHPWMLTGPWYRWQTPGVPGSGRQSAPVLQKFASDDFVNEFLRRPQRSLKFDPDVDQVFAVHFESAQLLSGPLAGKLATLYPRDADGNANPSRTKLVPTGVTKLFLDTHSRHYLVVCELHCDVAGFPSPARDEVCQAGFVVRRSYLSYAESARPFAQKLLREIVGIQSQLAELEETAPARPRAARRRAEKIERMKLDGRFYPARDKLQAELAQMRGALDKWKVANGVRSVQQGWVPGAHERMGAWQVVEDQPQELTEAWFPLYPVFADPARPDHDATGRTMYFGVVPTVSFDTDGNGKARFDDRSLYEIRCFVRRHDPHCPRKLEAPDCHGPLTWSRPTQRYQLAAQFDLEGTANRPITIQMPNLAELAAQAVKRPFGKYSPVKVIQPQGLNPKVDGTSVSGGGMGGFQICFFSIPLITIVALFVLNIFLPIVVFLFGLWFLLAFKFCIPPGISLDAGLQAELKAVPPQVDLAASVDVDFDADGINETTLTAAQLNADINVKVSGLIEAGSGLDPGLMSGKLNALSTAPLVELGATFSEVDALPDDPRTEPLTGVDVSAQLEYEAPVTAVKAASTGVKA
ncbi:MAG TPA: hypothetical protein VFU53_03730 [Burkholderiales bacterium]|nr:hypothetical protein [Burkholderiales bacterium]